MQAPVAIVTGSTAPGYETLYENGMPGGCGQL